MIRIKQLFSSTKGNAMVEFALSATLLVPIFVGIFQFGYSMYTYNELVGAVRAGVRYASLAKISNAGDGSKPAAYDTAVKNMVVYGTTSPAQNQQPVVRSLSTGNVAVDITFQAVTNVPTDVTVSVSSFQIDAIVKTFTVAGKPLLKMPYFGKYCSTGTTC